MCSPRGCVHRLAWGAGTAGGRCEVEGVTAPLWLMLDAVVKQRRRAVPWPGRVAGGAVVVCFRAASAPRAVRRQRLRSSYIVQHSLQQP
jgi:hypothetical protein